MKLTDGLRENCSDQFKDVTEEHLVDFYSLTTEERSYGKASKTKWFEQQRQKRSSEKIKEVLEEFCKTKSL